MSEQPSIRNHYGFSIEVHAGGRRVWPPSFKRYIRAKIESGELTTEDVTKECRVSKSLVYKWRSDVAQHRATFGVHPAKPTFAEVMLDHADEPLPEEKTREEPIRLRGDVVDLTLPATYPVDDLAKLDRALEQAGR